MSACLAAGVAGVAHVAWKDKDWHGRLFDLPLDEAMKGRINTRILLMPPGDRELAVPRESQEAARVAVSLLDSTGVCLASDLLASSCS